MAMRTPTSTFEGLPNETIEDIFTDVEAISIPSMRTISRRIAECLQRLFRWHLRAMEFTRASRMLAVDCFRDLSEVSTAELKEIVLRTERLENNWSLARPRCARPQTTWRNPDTPQNARLFLTSLYSEKFFLYMSNDRTYKIWDLRTNTLAASLEDLGPNYFLDFMSLSAPSVGRGIAYTYTQGFRANRILFFNLEFQDVDPTARRFTKVAEYSLARYDPVTDHSQIRVLDMNEQSIAFLNLSQAGGQALLCVIFDRFSRYCVVPARSSRIKTGTSAEIFRPRNSDTLIVRFSGPKTCTSRTFSLRYLSEIAERVNEDNPMDFNKVTKFTGRPSISTRSKHWRRCCQVPDRTLQLTYAWELDSQYQAWSVYNPGSSTFRTCSVCVLELKMNPNNHEAADTSFYMTQFYSSMEGPLAAHRLVHKLKDPLCDETGSPVCIANFDRFCWIERDRGPENHDTHRLSLLMLSFPRYFKDSGTRKDVSKEVHSKGPKIGILDVPVDTLRKAQQLFIGGDLGTIQVQTTDAELHTFYYV